jgi:hypothetical protein
LQPSGNAATATGLADSLIQQNYFRSQVKMSSIIKTLLIIVAVVAYAYASNQDFEDYQLTHPHLEAE